METFVMGFVAAIVIICVLRAIADAIDNAIAKRKKVTNEDRELELNGVK